MRGFDSSAHPSLTRTGRTAAVVAACVVAAAAGLSLAVGASAPALAGNTTMKMDEPMAGEMKKEGMKKGDVKEHAEKWDRKMKAMMEEEQKQKRGEPAKK